MPLYKDQFSEAHDFPRVDKPSKILIIASTARCGSHMFGHALYQTGKFGFPLEYGNAANLAEWKRRLKIEDFGQVMSEIQRRRTSPNGVFGIKIHYKHIKLLGGFDNLGKLFPGATYILLSRKDVMGQAISLSIAKQTGMWIAGQTTSKVTPEYDFDHIDRCLRETIKDNASWRYVLAASGSKYMEMDFDAVRLDVTQSILDAARFVGVDIAREEIKEEQATEKQSNEINKEWRKRFTAEFKQHSAQLFSDSTLARVLSKISD